MRLVESPTFPWGTMTVNLLGCFLFGLAWIAGESLRLSAEMRVIVLVGFMGAFTTFSTFAFESAQLLQRGQWWYACGNLLVQNVLGLLGVAMGIAVGREFGRVI